MNKHKRWAGYAVLSTAAFAATVGTPAIVAHADVYFAEGTKVTGNFIITKPVELTTSNPEALSDAKVIIDPVDAGAEIDLKAVKITNIEIRGSVKLKSGALDGANIVLNPSNSDAKIDLTGTNAMTVEVKSLVNEIKVPNGAVVTAPKEIAGELEGKVKNAKGDKVVVKEESDQTVPTDAVKVASAKSTIEGLNISWNTDVATTVVSANIAIENATLPEGVTAVVAEGTDSNAGKVVITITSGTESDTIVISAAVPTESIEAVNNAKDVTSLRGAIATHWKALGISEDIKNNFMSLPEGAGRQLAVYQFVKATGTFTDASTLKETFEYAVNQEFHKYEFIKAVDGAKDVNEMEVALNTYVPTVHADRVQLIDDLKAKGMTNEAIVLEGTTYTTVLTTVIEMIDGKKSLLELAGQLLEKREATPEKAFFGTENIVNTIQGILSAVPTESIEAVNNAKDVTSLRGAIATHWKALGISEDIKNNFMSLPEGAGRQLAVYQFVKATGTFTDASTLKETFEYAVNQEFHKYEFIKAVDGAKDVNEMEVALNTYVPTVHADRVQLIDDLKAKGMTNEAIVLEGTTYTTVLTTVIEMIDGKKSLSELAGQLLEKREATPEKAFFGTENIVNTIQGILSAVPTESIEAVNNAKDVTSLRGAIATHWKALGISEDIKNNFMSLPEGAGRQLAVYQFVKATGTFTDASTLKETFEYAVNQEFHKYEFIKAVDGAKDVNEMEVALNTYVPTVHADRVQLIDDLKAKGMTNEAIVLEGTTYTTVLTTVNEMIDGKKSLSELAGQLLEKREATPEKAFFGTENIVNAIQGIFNSKGETLALSSLSKGVNFTINNGIMELI